MLGTQDLNADEMTRKLEDMLPVIRQVNEQFRDPVSLSLLILSLFAGQFYRSLVGNG